MQQWILNTSFWKFCTGFTVLVAVSFSIIVAVGYYEVEIKGVGTREAISAAPVEP